MSTDEKGAIGPDGLTGEYVAIDYKALGSKIRHVRGTATQADFAKQFGIPRAEVSKIERGEGRPTAELLYNICLKHHLSLEWMLSGHEPSNESAQEELFKEEPVKAAPVQEAPRAVCETPILELTEVVEWFRLHPEDLGLVNQLIEGKKLMMDAMKKLEK